LTSKTGAAQAGFAAFHGFFNAKNRIKKRSDMLFSQKWNNKAYLFKKLPIGMVFGTIR
jgi:hypothetical protein